jgi:hypothetical protein
MSLLSKLAMTRGVLAAIDVIDGSNLNAEEKRHLRRLDGGLNLSPDLFEGTPNFGQILSDFPAPPPAVQFPAPPPTVQLGTGYEMCSGFRFLMLTYPSRVLLRPRLATVVYTHVVVHRTRRRHSDTSLVYTIPSKHRERAQVLNPFAIFFASI